VGAGEILDSSRAPLLEGIRKARSEVLIATPFISLEVAKEVSLATLAAGAENRMLLTALNDRAVRGGFLSPKALRMLSEAEFEIRSLRNLHAKVCLTDGSAGILGSGNLTTAGLGGKRRKNLELGIELAKPQAAATRKIVAGWWKKAKPVSDAVLDRYSKLAPSHRGGAGGGFGSFLYGDELDLPEQRPSGSTGIWLKMLYHHRRRDQPNWWRKVNWVSDGRPPPSPQKLVNGPRYKVGDLLLFYLVEVGGPVRCCPTVAEVRELPRHDPGFVRANGFPGDELQWPWVTEVEIIDSTSLEKAPDLETIKVEGESTGQHGHLVLQPDQLAAARAIIAAHP